MCQTHSMCASDSLVFTAYNPYCGLPDHLYIATLYYARMIHTIPNTNTPLKHV